MASFNSPAKSLAAVVKLALSLEFRVRVTRRAGHAGARDFAHPPRPQRAAALIGPAAIVAIVAIQVSVPQSPLRHVSVIVRHPHHEVAPRRPPKPPKISHLQDAA
ncbi:hypothetical protein CIHG_09219 [Coccidioides immitis H538.4]|uniref:Uncharacterized protein n=3 Tax=Coccidioides immitis TaxID=5501 RepID=A0A0J8R5Y1_COCIT|nr:hypothetical protein CIRG_05979 [Coccidioides immitis RMSCC 2394]KMU80499.1 hypothetical protein CISG_02350 [Coccidioides immitis RMSCC 3703]KMU91342.1 hypothetical protein CIHG_09219 [Coccidioides immitis H538.4]